MGASEEKARRGKRAARGENKEERIEQRDER